MSTDDGSATVVFNGELYNYVELRSLLQSLGHVFRSSGDTEVLLKAYQEWGTNCIDRFNGMWAFLIYDQRNRRIFGSRDRFGMKPLYWYRSSSYTLFASEIKAIRGSGLYTSVTNMRAAAAYLAQDRLDESTETFYDGIESVPAATAFEMDVKGGLRQWCYWSLNTAVRENIADPSRRKSVRRPGFHLDHMRLCPSTRSSEGR
jgi:asparagine synthase (glutamine-hydrolysing)